MPLNNSSTSLFHLPTRRQIKQHKINKNMSNENSELDIMSQLDAMNITDIETAYPLLKSGIVSAQISAISSEQDEGKPPYVKVEYTLAQDWETTPHEGRPIRTVATGFPLTERIYVQPWVDPKTGETKNFGRTRLAQLREAVLGEPKDGDKLSDFTPLMGQTIMLKLKFDPAPKNKKTNEVYGPQTTVDGYVRKGK